MSISGTVDSGNWATKTITQNLSITGSFWRNHQLPKCNYVGITSAFEVSSGSLTAAK